METISESQMQEWFRVRNQYELFCHWHIENKYFFNVYVFIRGINIYFFYTRVFLFSFLFFLDIFFMCIKRIFFFYSFSNFSSSFYFVSIVHFLIPFILYEITKVGNVPPPPLPVPSNERTLFLDVTIYYAWVFICDIFINI